MDLTFCDDPEEVVLLVTKCVCYVAENDTQGPFAAVLTITNKTIHVLKITRPETEDPSEWLAKVKFVIEIYCFYEIYSLVHKDREKAAKLITRSGCNKISHLSGHNMHNILQKTIVI